MRMRYEKKNTDYYVYRLICPSKIECIFLILLEQYLYLLLEIILYTFLPIPSGNIIFIISLHKNHDKKYYTVFTT